MEVVTPPHSVGPAYVALDFPEDSNLDSYFASSFIYQGSAPTVTSITPPQGVLSGGTAVTIQGTNFADSPNFHPVVSFGGTDVVATFVNSTTLNAQTPPHAPGKVDVTVKNIDNQNATLSQAFLYAGINSVNPSAGSIAGGTVVTITSRSVT